MRITFFAPQLPKDGITTYTNYLVDGLHQVGVETEIIPLEPDKLSSGYLSEVAGQLNHKKLIHIQHEFGMWGDWKNPFNQLFKNFLNEIKIPKVVTVHSFHPWLVKFPSYKNSSLFKDLPKKFMRSILTNNPWGRKTFGGVFKLADKVIVHTHFHKEHLLKMGVLRLQIEVIPHGVLTYNIKGDGERFRQKYQLEGKKVLSIFGFWDPSKGFEVAQKALRQLPEEFVLVIAGGPRTKAQEDYFRNFQFSIFNFQLGDRVRVTNFLEENEIADLMAATDFVLIPQIYATGSGSLMHALANEKVVIASDLPFFKEVNQQEECLALFKAGDSQELVKKILEIEKDLQKQEVLKQNTKRYVERFTWENVAKLHKKLYANLLFS